GSPPVGHRGPEAAVNPIHLHPIPSLGMNIHRHLGAMAQPARGTRLLTGPVSIDVLPLLGLGILPHRDRTDPSPTRIDQTTLPAKSAPRARGRPPVRKRI